MSNKEIIESKTEALLVPICEDAGVSIYDVEYVKEGGDYILRAYIDKEGGVNIDDCVAVNRVLSDLLDKEDYIEEAYVLEVSSPGLGRKLTKDKHLEKALGQSVDIKTYKPVDKVKDFTGILKSYDKDKIVIEADDKELEFKRSDIAKISLTLEL